MRKGPALLGSALFLVVAPGTLAVYVPWLISRWHGDAALGLQIAGGLLIAAGTPCLLESFVRFAVVGLGTPAPVAPPQHLVVSGLYRHVRNPMYVAIVTTVIGQALLFGNLRLLGYAGALWAGFHLWVLIHEEPALRSSFGDEYRDYCAHVRRWIPRLSPWR